MVYRLVTVSGQKWGNLERKDGERVPPRLHAKGTVMWGKYWRWGF